MKSERVFRAGWFLIGLILSVGAGCDRPARLGSLILTKVPASAATNAPETFLDANYPAGSRVVLREKPFDATHEKILSGNLVAAGSPVLSYDGQRVFFVGKATLESDWQIYETVLADGGPRAVTSMPGGAMSPTLLPNGNLVFISPVPRINATETNLRSALFVKGPGADVRQLTFGPGSIVDSTMLSDGRILFVAMQSARSNSFPQCALYTINNDGTEVTAFLEKSIPGSLVRRPRQIPADNRIAFILTKPGFSSPGGRTEFLSMAKPRLGGVPLLPNSLASVFSVETGGEGELLVCAENSLGTSRFPAVFRVGPSAAMLGPALVADPNWGFLEAAEVAYRGRPMGRLSTVDFTRRTGKILCLDANFTRDTSETNLSPPTATHVRVTAEISPGTVRPLGEIRVQPDGSFLAEVPADVLLGFELTDDSGRVLRSERPSMWVRPGENRSCVGCHEPAHRAPHNRRPLAVKAPVPVLNLNAAEARIAQFAK